MADRFGRRPVIFASVIVVLAADITTAVTSSLVAFFAARMFAGASCNALALVFLVMLFEVSGSEIRQELAWAAFLPPILTSLLPTLAAGAMLDRRVLSFIMLAVASLLIPSCYFVEESAQWRRAVGSNVERHRFATSRVTSIEPNASTSHRRHRRGRAKRRRARAFTAVDLLAQEALRPRTLTLSFLFLILFAGLYVTFSGTASGLPSRSETTLAGSYRLLLELVARSLSVLVSDWLLRMPTRREELVLAFCTILVAGWAKHVAKRIASRGDPGDPPLVVIVMGELLLDAILVALVLVFACTLEAYRTEVRATGLCAVYFSGGIGATLSPMLADLEPQSLLLVGGTVAMLAAISATRHLPPLADYELFLAQIQAHESERWSVSSVRSSVTSKNDQLNDQHHIFP
ncbi:solute carrier family 22 member 7-like [Dermacentor albipictus]|uniref:solute carrier family 22 member 7-like n=1 Tax=Dermacentor albipictus TaxID=60249 RepID=UPI0031FE37CB